MKEKRPSVEEVIARQQAFDRRVKLAQADILRMVLPTGVRVSFGEGQRAADVAMVLLKGERAKVLTLPSRLEDELGLDVHVVRSTFAGEDFELLLVFTEPLEDQRLRSPERRAALRAQLERLEQAGAEDADLLDTGDEEQLDTSTAGHPEAGSDSGEEEQLDTSTAGHPEAGSDSGEEERG